MKSSYQSVKISALMQILPKIERWPAEDPQILAEIVMEIEAGAAVSDAERAGVGRGLEDLRMGRFASEEALAAVRAKFRAE